MKILIPKQHGAWAMLIIPFALSMVAGGMTIWHLFLFLGWFFLYLATFPLVMVFRKKKNKMYQRWSLIYGSIALISLIPILFIDWTLVYFGLSMIPLFLVNIYFAMKNKERAFTNDLVAILSFCIGGLASYYLGSGNLGQAAWFIFVHSFLFFLGCTFYVKTMIREKKNRIFKYYSWSYHLLIPLAVLFIEGSWLVLAYIPSSIRAWVLYGKKISVMKIGIIEIINSLYFLIVMLIYISLKM